MTILVFVITLLAVFLVIGTVILIPQEVELSERANHIQNWIAWIIITGSVGFFLFAMWIYPVYVIN